MTDIILRPATLADLELLRRWDAEPHVIAAHSDSGEPEDWNWPVELARTPTWREQFIAERNGRPLGFLQILDPEHEETHYWGDCGPGLRAIDIWIGKAQDLGQGHGTRLMQLAIERCFANPSVRAILLDPLASNVRAHRFYERLGFRAVEERVFDGAESVVYRLDRPAPPDRTGACGRERRAGTSNKGPRDH